MATGCDPFSWMDIPQPLVNPALGALGFGNAAFDALFYDVSRMVTDLFMHGILVKGAVFVPSQRFSQMTGGFRQVDLSTAANPAGSVLVVDAGRSPCIKQFEDVTDFISWVKTQERPLRSVSVTGVGSSALGSAAFAWNVSTALDEPVAAIVPGYGVVDAIQQGLDGWLGVFTLWFTQIAQDILARGLPMALPLDRCLIMTPPSGTKTPERDRDLGCSLSACCTRSSAVLHAILKDAPDIRRVLGHSKGALAIKNAIRDLPLGTTRRLHVVTFGCAIAEDQPTAGYSQFLGLIDGLGLLSSFGNPSMTLIHTHHSTNTSIPLSMPVSVLTRLAMMREAPSEITYPTVETLAQRHPVVARTLHINGHPSLEGAKP